VLLLGLSVLYSMQRVEYILYTLLIWYPLETLVLRYTPVEYYAAVRYFPEVILYATFFISWVQYYLRTKRVFPSSPLNKWLLLYVLVAIISYVSNGYRAFIWILGVRQLVRFVLVFFIVLFEHFSNDVLKKFLWIGGVVIVAEALLGIVQYVTGGALDSYLFFTDAVSIGSAIQLDGVQQTWAPGQRVFATLGRYDRLGSLIMVGLIMFFPWVYAIKNTLQKERWWVVFGIGLVGLVLTYSRANWIAFIVGVFVVGYFIIRDRRLMQFILYGAGAIGLYLVFVFVTNSFGVAAIEQGSQTIRDRIVEAVSPYSWQQGYEGYGRVFFIINTPLMVVSQYPLFGVGPGNYGGGVAASLLNTAVYDKLHLPFGIQNTYGQIDNNWMSIWGELGTLGLLVWIGLFYSIFSSAYYVQEHTTDETQRLVAQGVCGSTVAVVVLGFFGPYFEFRSLMVYYWLLVGVVCVYFRDYTFSWNFLREKR
jgi:hypothetical protein